jgi:hypothetical protein
MLRNVIAVFAVGLVAFALVITISYPAEWPLLAGALLFAVGCLYERRYRGGAPTTDASAFEQTRERFVDPETGRLVSVWVDRRTGERQYRDEGEPRPTAV